MRTRMFEGTISLPRGHHSGARSSVVPPSACSTLAPELHRRINDKRLAIDVWAFARRDHLGDVHDAEEDKGTYDLDCWTASHFASVAWEIGPLERLAQVVDLQQWVVSGHALTVGALFAHVLQSLTHVEDPGRLARVRTIIISLDSSSFVIRLRSRHGQFARESSPTTLTIQVGVRPLAHGLLRYKFPLVAAGFAAVGLSSILIFFRGNGAKK